MSEIPIDVVERRPGLKFRWQQPVHYLGGAKEVECVGPLPPGADEAVATLIASHQALLDENRSLQVLAAKLQAFKDWVHAYLDAHGVPKEFPDGSHSKEGCRIGDRMDWVVKCMGATSAEDALRAQNKAAVQEIERLRGELEEAKRRAPAVQNQQTKGGKR